MYQFRTSIVWEHELKCRASTSNNPDLTVATPREFGGPGGAWSPEELFVASIGTCLLSTFLYFAQRFDVAFESYASTATGSLAKTSQGLRFTVIDVSIAIGVPDDKAVEKASLLRLKERLEKYCPVSASLNCPVRLVLEIAPGAAHQTLTT